MIHCCGLPRSAGQSLSSVLNILYPGLPVIHSVEGNRWDVVHDGVLATVETYAPYTWLERHWEDSLYIVNWRESESWYTSCRRVYQKSQDQNWSHPIWKYPLDSFLDYYNEYFDRIKSTFPKDRLLWWNIIENPSWGPICDFLGLPVPEVAFPNVDKHGRPPDVILDDGISWPSPW